MSTCTRCEGCGQIADSEDGEPWTAWASLSTASGLAVRMGLVNPIPCPACSGEKKCPVCKTPVSEWPMQGRSSLFREIREGMSWLVINTTPNTVDIIPDGPVAESPIDSSHTHCSGEECACGPTVVPVERDDGSVGWLYQHKDLKR